MTYSIPECNIESLEKKLTRIKNKCAKYGNEFHYERIGEHFEEKKFTDYNDVLFEINGQRVYRSWTEVIKYIDIEVEGKAEVNGWSFAASLEYHDKGNIIKSAGIEIPSRFYDCKPWCEHCKTKRDRAKSFIVFNEETNEFKQVGKSCLKDFTGGLSAEQAANFESFFKEVEEACEYAGGYYEKSYFKVIDFLTVAAETIRLYGYVKRDSRDTSTADRAEELYRSVNHMRLSDSKSVRARIYDAECKGFSVSNEASVELAKTVREWIISNERDDNYFHNLKVACSLDYVDYKGLGLLVSAFPAYNKELEIDAARRAREAAEAAAREASAYLGNVGDKVSFEIADFRCITSWDTQWGTTYVYKFADKEGHEATWKTSNWVEEKCIGKTISGKVKEQKEYRGIKQTELTRCKIA
jgi:hypothetical protein